MHFQKDRSPEGAREAPEGGAPEGRNLHTRGHADSVAEEDPETARGGRRAEPEGRGGGVADPTREATAAERRRRGVAPSGHRPQSRARRAVSGSSPATAMGDTFTNVNS